MSQRHRKGGRGCVSLEPVWSHHPCPIFLVSSVRSSSIRALARSRSGGFPWRRPVLECAAFREARLPAHHLRRMGGALAALEWPNRRHGPGGSGAAAKAFPFPLQGCRRSDGGSVESRQGKRSSAWGGLGGAASRVQAGEAQRGRAFPVRNRWPPEGSAPRLPIPSACCSHHKRWGASTAI